MVSGIVPDCSDASSSTFATFGRNAGEPVRIWDARKIHSHLCEIIPLGGGRRAQASVGAVAWSISRPGIISIAVGNSIKQYDTCSPGSRALPVGVSYLDDDFVDRGSATSGDDDSMVIQCLAYQPQIFHHGFDAAKLTSSGTTTTTITSPLELFPHRALAVTSQGQIHVIPELQVAPIAVSKRDGRIASCLGGTVWIGPTTEGMFVLLLVSTCMNAIHLSVPHRNYHQVPRQWNVVQSHPRTFLHG